MAIKVRIVEQPNPKSPNGKPIYVPEIADPEVVSVETMAKTMAEKLSMTEEEFIATMYSVAETMQFFLSQGESISIKGFGTFHPTTVQMDTAPGMRNKANAEMMKIDFEPSEDFLSRFDDLEFEIVE